jgi:hypothetical protein
VRFWNVRRLTLGSHRFERVDKFKYLGSLVIKNSEYSTEIKKIRIAAGNICYFSLIKLFKSKAVVRNTKVRMYKTIIRPVVLKPGASQLMTREVFEHGRGKC